MAPPPLCGGWQNNPTTSLAANGADRCVIVANRWWDKRGGGVALFDKKHGFPGKLIIVEGIDGSGKSTQVSLLKKWLESQGFSVFFTEWNSSELVKETTREGKKKNILTPTTFSLLHAADFADRLNYQIIPPLKAGMVVLADRYA